MTRCKFCNVLAFIGQVEPNLTKPKANPSYIFDPDDLKTRSQWAIFEQIRGLVQITCCVFFTFPGQLDHILACVTSKVGHSDLFSKLI